MDEFFEGVSYKNIEVLGNFQLSSDTPTNYCDKLAIINQNRAFPDQSYPSGADPDHEPAVQGLPVPSSSSSGAVGASTSTASGSVVPPSSDASVKELHDTLIAHHHSVVKLLENAGIKDVCSLYKGSRVDRMLNVIGS